MIRRPCRLRVSTIAYLSRKPYDLQFPCVRFASCNAKEGFALTVSGPPFTYGSLGVPQFSSTLLTHEQNLTGIVSCAHSGEYVSFAKNLINRCAPTIEGLHSKEPNSKSKSDPAVTLMCPFGRITGRCFMVWIAGIHKFPILFHCWCWVSPRMNSLELCAYEFQRFRLWLHVSSTCLFLHPIHICQALHTIIKSPI